MPAYLKAICERPIFMAFYSHPAAQWPSTRPLALFRFPISTWNEYPMEISDCKKNRNKNWSCCWCWPAETGLFVLSQRGQSCLDKYLNRGNSWSLWRQWILILIPMWCRNGDCDFVKKLRISDDFVYRQMTRDASPSTDGGRRECPHYISTLFWIFFL